MKTTHLTMLATAVLFGAALPNQVRASDEMATKTGEVVDMVCYLDHGATGEKHADCATKCISSGLPVGLKTEDGTYLLVGDHKPMNDVLAPLAAKTITVKGKVVEKDGFKMIENAEIVKS